MQSRCLLVQKTTTQDLFTVDACSRPLVPSYVVLWVFCQHLCKETRLNHYKSCWSAHGAVICLHLVSLTGKWKQQGQFFKSEISIKEETFLPADSSLSSAVDGGFLNFDWPSKASALGCLDWRKCLQIALLWSTSEQALRCVVFFFFNLDTRDQLCFYWSKDKDTQTQKKQSRRNTT